MKRTKSISVIVAGFACCLAALAEKVSESSQYDEAALKKRYEAFVLSLNHASVSNDYPKAVRDLQSNDPERQILALKTLAETGEPYVIPWMVPLLEATNSSVAGWAGASMNNAVSICALRRRDPSRSYQVVLRPRAEGDPDLRALAWIVLKMFRKPDDGNTQAYAASMASYLELREFEGELRKCLQSRHPSVRKQAFRDLRSLGFSVEEPVMRKPPSAPYTSAASNVPVILTVKSVHISSKGGAPLLEITVNVKAKDKPVILNSFRNDCTYSIQFDSGALKGIAPSSYGHSSNEDDWVWIDAVKGRDFNVSQWGKKYVDGPVTSAVVRFKCGIFTDDEWSVYEVVSERFKMK